MPEQRWICRRLACWMAAVALAGWSASASAQTAPRYQPWSDPAQAGPADERLNALIERLERLISEAERQRAADPRFLSDLRAAIRQQPDRPWGGAVLEDDFADGDFTRNPAWTVTAGQFSVERGYGLRSIVEIAAPPQGTGQSGGSPDATTAIIGGILT